MTLLDAGRSVVILEQGLATQGASSRNGGMCGDLLKPSFDHLSARFGKQTATALYAEARDAYVFFREFLAEHKIDCDFAQVGRITGAFSDAQLKSLERETEKFTRQSARLTKSCTDPTSATRSAPTPTSACASYRITAGSIRPSTPPRSYDLVRERGGEIHERTRLTGFARSGNEFELTTSRGMIRSRELIVATNGYTSSATYVIQRRIVPVTAT